MPQTLLSFMVHTLMESFVGYRLAWGQQRNKKNTRNLQKWSQT